MGSLEQEHQCSWAVQFVLQCLSCMHQMAAVVLGPPVSKRKLVEEVFLVLFMAFPPSDEVPDVSAGCTRAVGSVLGSGASATCGCAG